MSDSYVKLGRQEANRLGQVTKIGNVADAATQQTSNLTLINGRIERLNELLHEHAQLIKQLYAHDDCVFDDVSAREDKFSEAYVLAFNELLVKQELFEETRLTQPSPEDIETMKMATVRLATYEQRIKSNFYDGAALDEIKLNVFTLEDIEKNYVASCKAVLISTSDADEKNKLRNELSDFEVRINHAMARLEGARKLVTPLSPLSEIAQPTLQVQRAPHVAKTERIPLPQFDGTSAGWIKFRDMFKSLVHDSASFSDVEKFHHLHSCMKLPPKETNVLALFSFTAENYQKAWAALCSRYNDDRKLLQHHLTALFDVKKMCNTQPVTTELRRVIDSFGSHISSLAQLGLELNTSDKFINSVIVHMMITRLDEETLLEWTKDNTNDFPSYEELNTYLVAFWRSLDIMPVTKKTSFKAPDVKTSRSGKALLSNGSRPTAVSACQMCNEPHRLWQCDKFRAVPAADRLKTVKEKKLCLNCFSDSHLVAACTSKYRCKTCDKSHHSLLHLGSTSRPPALPEGSRRTLPTAPAMSPNVPPFQPYSMTRNSLACESEDAGITSHSSSAFLVKRRQTLLSTIEVYAVDSSGNMHLCRALLDSGSDTCFITASFAKKIKLKLSDACITITGIDEKTSVVKHKTTTLIKSRYGPFECDVDCSVLSSITGMIPSNTLNKTSFKIPDGYFLADPQFQEPSNVDMLLSADVFYESLLTEKLKLPNGLMMLETRFGWIIGGTVTANVYHHTSLLSCFNQQPSIDDVDIGTKLDKFLAADECDFIKPSFSAEEKYCEEVFISSTKRDDDGKFVVQMPLKSKIDSLGHNLANARRALSWQEKRRQKDSVYNSLYTDYMNDYEKTGHMQEVEPDSIDGSYYLPHHGVVKMSSTTTKLRPVFNASSVSETGVSLNDVLCVGPMVQPESFDILLRFREKQFVITGDITKMYRQIWVHPSQRKFLRILWRSDMNEPVKHYQLNTVTFGTSCAPFLATRVISHLAQLNKEKFPEASSVIENSFYVDDLLFGTNCIEEGIKLRDQIRYILATAGMPLCKLSANHPELLVGLDEKLVASTDDTETQVTKTLGIVYNARNDHFSYQLNSPSDCQLTKAQVLSEIASIYDPIGWIGPVVLKAKIFMKKLWLNNLQWKDVLPDDLQREWNDFRSKLYLVDNVRIRRHCLIANHVSVELHGFCDASIEAYGAVIYAHSFDQTGHKQTSIICAKSRVAPKNQKTLARLELCGATLLAKLITRTRAIFSATIQDVTLWSDSTIVLNWIAITPSQLSTFVGNRVAVIQDLTHQLTWKHIRGIDNPADVISRGLAPDEIEDCTLWWNAPSFFEKPKTDWPSSIITINDNDPEVVKEMKKSLTVSTPTDLFHFIENKFSKPRTLRNVIAYVRRFANNSHKDSVKLSGPLSVDEIEAAEVSIAKVVQQTFFSREYTLLQSQIEPAPQLDRKSQLLSLAPFLGTDGLIRVGGRIRASSELTTNQKHPIILPHCHFTTILIRELHMKHAHPGPLAMRAIVREQYHPLKALIIIRKVIHGCLTCFLFKTTTTNQFMSDLPPARVTMTPPFTNTAVDYAGFYTIRTSITQRSSTVKAYIALFKCMCTNAIHLELVSDLSTQAFIAALDRFVSRRGLSIALFTDNATCFAGADHELKRIIESHDPEFKQYCTEQSIKWTFTTPRAPHAGGVYESGIKLMKHHLKRVIGDRNYTFEQLTTILCKVEAIVNSRPITPMNENPFDLQVLTPGHFLTGRSLVAKPERNLLLSPTSHLNRWEGLQQVQQRFWSVWYHDYLNTLQTRPVNFREKSTFNIGDMVLIHDSNLPPLKWLLGRIVKLFPGKDKIVRNVRLITRYGDKDRHVRYLRPLPFIPESPSSAGQGVSDVTVST